MLKLITQIAGTLFGSELVFILLASHKATQWLKYWVFIGGIVYLYYVASKATRGASYVTLFFVSITSSVVFVSLHELIGFVWFDGIVKDLVFLSMDNLEICMDIFMWVALVVFVGLMLVKLAQKQFDDKEKLQSN